MSAVGFFSFDFMRILPHKSLSCMNSGFYKEAIGFFWKKIGVGNY